MVSEEYLAIFLTHSASFIVLSAASATILMLVDSLLMGENKRRVWHEVEAGNQKESAVATQAQSQLRAHGSPPPVSSWQELLSPSL